LKDIYNAEVVTGKNGDAGLLDAPGYSFPYFGVDGSTSLNANEEFKNFAETFKEENYFLGNRLDAADLAAFDFSASTVAGSPGSIGLVNIPIHQYGDDKSDLFLVEQSTGITSAFETFAGPLLDLYHLGSENSTSKDIAGPVEAGSNAIMPDRYNQEDLFSNDHDILDNFLFAPVGATGPLNVLDAFPYPVTSGSPTDNGVVDLKTTYGTDNNPATADGHVKLFNKESDFYHDDAQYMINAVRLATISDPTTVTKNDVRLPYIMIRNDKGVHIEGIDGVGYLTQPQEDDTAQTDSA
jgi:hypothetical protein